MTLTPREFQAIRLWALGTTADEIARQMGISRSTLWKHFGAALARAGVPTRVELLACLGWLKVPDHLEAPGSNPDERPSKWPSSTLSRPSRIRESRVRQP